MPKIDDCLDASEFYSPMYPRHCGLCDAWVRPECYSNEYDLCLPCLRSQGTGRPVKRLSLIDRIAQTAWLFPAINVALTIGYLLLLFILVWCAFAQTCPPPAIEGVLP